MILWNIFLINYQKYLIKSFTKQQQVSLFFQSLPPKFIIELNSLAKNPYSKNKIIKKKSDIIKKINSIESEIKNLKNNIYYLKESVAAENLKKEYMSKIDQSDKEIESLKLQLNLINKV